MAGITTEERIRRRMVFCGVTRDTAIALMEIEGGGDVIEIVDGKRIMPAWWTEGQAERRRDAKRMRHQADQRAASGTFPPEG